MHITPWFPHSDDVTRAIFIKRHIESLSAYVSQKVLHIDCDDRSFIDDNSDQLTTIQIKTKFTFWRILEWIFYRKLKKYLIQNNVKENFTHVNFHIAYPALIHFEKLRKHLPAKICVTEHWSIYHFNFYSNKKPQRLAQLFQHKVPILCVSSCLGDDIQKFTGTKIPFEVLPNVVSNDVFNFKESNANEHFFTAAFWKSPKNPIPLLIAIANLKRAGHVIKLRIAGHGPMNSEMKNFVTQNDLVDDVAFLGILDSKALALEMNSAKAFILPSNYETFSVVIAEALCCGCPVLADDVGAISELVNDENGCLRSGILIWEDLILNFDSKRFDRKKIAQSAAQKFSTEVVGTKYFKFLQSL